MELKRPTIVRCEIDFDLLGMIHTDQKAGREKDIYWGMGSNNQKQLRMHPNPST